MKENKIENMVQMISEKQCKDHANCFIDPNCLKLINISQGLYAIHFAKLGKSKI